MEIIKLINARDEASLKDASFTLTIPWDNILPAIEKDIMLRPDEMIDALVLSKDNIKVKVSRKKGRKIASKDEPELFNHTT
jgi:hypothetical protein